MVDGTMSVAGRRIALCGTRGLIVVGANVCYGLLFLILYCESTFPRTCSRHSRTLKGASPFALIDITKYSKYMAHYFIMPT